MEYIYKATMFTGLKGLGNGKYHTSMDIKSEVKLSEEEVKSHFYEILKSYPKTHYVEVETIKDLDASNKVKVKYDTAEAIDYVLKSNENDANSVLKEYGKYFNTSYGSYCPNNFYYAIIEKELNLLQLANALNVGYESIQTPYDVLREKYNELSDYDEIDRAVKDTFRFVLDTLNLKVESINDHY